ncbi:MAG TPA: transposase family protein, partial [bacterium]|nr:transposase family protein [bacterium]
MGPRSVHEYAAALGPRYHIASRTEKKRLLTEFCRVTGRHRKSAIRLLRRRAGSATPRPGRPRCYGPEVVALLRTVWEASDYLCGKRLAPFLPPLVDALERHRVLQVPPPLRPVLLHLSPATIDRLLRPHRRGHPRGLATTGPGHPALAAQVPIRTFGDWQDVRPGSLQADLVGHCGESTEGFYLTSLVAVDVATGWTECQAVWGKGYARVGTGIHLIRQRLPMPLRELHTDNGGEFLNHLLVPWCRREGIHVTRGRPWRKNDQAYAEQKNWAIVRRLIGYDRYTTHAALDHLNALYRILRLYGNFFQPLRKLTAKVRHGARVTKRYDRAQTPYQRLLATAVLTPDQRHALDTLYRTLIPVALRTQIHDALRQVWQLADRPREAATPWEAHHANEAVKPSPTEARRAISRREDKISIPPAVRR